MKKTKILQMGILMLLGAVALFGLFGCDIEEIIESASANVEAIREVTDSFDVTGLVDLNIQTSNGYVIVESADVTTVDVKAIIKSYADSLETAQERVNQIAVTMTQTGNTLEFEYRSGDYPPTVRNHTSVAFEVVVPVLADVDIDTSNGDVIVRGIEGEMLLDTSNGSIDVRDATGLVNADTSNGRVDVERFVGTLVVETSNGAIDIEDVEASVNARTSNGRIDFSGTLVGDTHSLRTSNGSIEVDVDATESINFDASTSTGVIRSNLALAGDTDGRDWNAVLNGPATKTLTIRTSNGTINIDGR